MTFPVLSLIVFIPLIGVVAVLILPVMFSRWVNLCITTLQLIASTILYYNFSTHSSILQEKSPWISLQFGEEFHISIEYFLYMDGLSVILIWLSGIVLFIGTLASWNINYKVKGYHTLYLLFNTSIMGCFLAMDFFLFFLFFEFMLLPMYFLIGIWGGTRREYAAVKFFIYTFVGSLFILAVMIGLYLSATLPGSETMHTFNLLFLTDEKNFIKQSVLSLDNPAQIWGYSLRSLAFLLLFIGFAIKLPIAPLHTWLPDAHVEAPTPISVLLAGIMLKVGGYGLIRIALPIFPEAAQEFSLLMGSLGGGSIIYGALNALAMDDLKKMVAYSSVSHMGFVLLGIASFTEEGLSGAIFQMVSHGVLSSMLFLIVGVIYDRTHFRQISYFKGLLGPMPWYGAFTVVAFFASLGLPLFSGFIGELFTLIGGFKSEVLPLWIPIVATLGIALGAGYFLWSLQRMFLGKLWFHPEIKLEADSLKDIKPTEVFMFTALTILTLALGVFPQIIFQNTQRVVSLVLQSL